jgi:hypothetical protein
VVEEVVAVEVLEAVAEEGVVLTLWIEPRKVEP